MRLRPVFQRMLSLAALTLLSALTFQAHAVPIRYVVDTGTPTGAGSFTLADTNHSNGDFIDAADLVDLSWTIPDVGAFDRHDLRQFQVGSWSLSDGLLSATTFVIEILGTNFAPFADCRVCVYSGNTAGFEVRINGTSGVVQVDLRDVGTERFRIRASTVPEPSTLGLTGLGLLMGWRARRQQGLNPTSASTTASPTRVHRRQRVTSSARLYLGHPYRPAWSGACRAAFA
jgi:hypothetical protein